MSRKPPPTPAAATCPQCGAALAPRPAPGKRGKPLAPPEPDPTPPARKPGRKIIPMPQW